MAKKIGVFLSARIDLPQHWIDSTQQFGERLGRDSHTLVYGGARKGLMEVLAQSVKQGGGRVYGVVPQILFDRNLVSDCLDVTIRCADLNDRKAILMRESDVLVVLPGGIGTLDELFTVLGANTIGTEHKPVILFNADGCWNTLIRLLDELTATKLAPSLADYALQVANSVEELIAMIDNA